MKVVCVVDSITDFNNKIATIKTHFGNDILFVVKAPLMPIFQTFGHQANAVYDKNLAKTIHLMLLRAEADDVVIYYTSLKINVKLISDFIAKIGNKAKIVNFMPKYNAFERVCLNAYNVYVKALFKSNDCLASPKLQFLPIAYVVNLLGSHFGNKLFEMPENLVNVCETEDKEINKTSKVKTKFGKSELICIISALTITLALILTLGLAKPNFLVGILFVCAYLLDLLVYIMLKCKAYFDSRFLK